MLAHRLSLCTFVYNIYVCVYIYISMCEKPLEQYKYICVFFENEECELNSTFIIYLLYMHEIE